MEEAVEHGGIEAFFFAIGDVAGVAGEDVVFACAQRECGLYEGGIFLGVGGLGDDGIGGAGFLADGLHLLVDFAFEGYDIVGLHVVTFGWLFQRHVIAVDENIAAFEAEDLFDLRTFFAEDALCIGR